ncbi:MAG: hypothetical protein QM784_27135 [Polyangiaceae bacterium]
MSGRVVIGGLLLVLLQGCGLPKGLHVTEVVTSPSKPSNVVSVVEVSDGQQPVSELRSSAFRLFEDRVVLDTATTRFRLLEPTSVISFHTALLVDLGVAPTEERRRELEGRIADFVSRARNRQSVTVLAFDGSQRIKHLGDFPLETGQSTLAPVQVRLSAPTDSSRNLRGAIVEALDILDARFTRSLKALRVGTLNVVTAGPDLAGRVSEASFDERLNRTTVLTYVHGLSSDDPDVKRLAYGGKFQTIDDAGSSLPFDALLARSNARVGSHYVLSYCSPSRSGERQLRVEVQRVRDDLEVDTASVDTHFDSTGFTSGCDSSRSPRSSELRRALGR